MRQDSSQHVSYVEGMMCHREPPLNRRSKYQESLPWGVVGVGGIKNVEETRKRPGLTRPR